MENVFQPPSCTLLIDPSSFLPPSPSTPNPHFSSHFRGPLIPRITGNCAKGKPPVSLVRTPISQSFCLPNSYSSRRHQSRNRRGARKQPLRVSWICAPVILLDSLWGSSMTASQWSIGLHRDSRVFSPANIGRNIATCLALKRIAENIIRDRIGDIVSSLSFAQITSWRCSPTALEAGFALLSTTSVVRVNGILSSERFCKIWLELKIISMERPWNIVIFNHSMWQISELTERKTNGNKVPICRVSYKFAFEQIPSAERGLHADVYWETLDWYFAARRYGSPHVSCIINAAPGTATSASG